MKGIVQQMQESPTVIIDGKFTKEDLGNLSVLLSLAAEKESKYRKERLKEIKNNEKYLIKRAKELNKPIPFEVANHGYLTLNKTYVGSEFLEKYKEWL